MAFDEEAMIAGFLGAEQGDIEDNDDEDDEDDRGVCFFRNSLAGTMRRSNIFLKASR